ncbi:outer membrane beta-barrel protein [Microbulbifer guangxiensis]|uniref:outer membrane beta-barrel protein n=1 Tax=Microbulbifer guangxiensis TaxID=2904249 RepID=UPI001F209C15|nr:outer membrane beta-barrel protein [Microbulbifer guangxiensis]
MTRSRPSVLLLSSLLALAADVAVADPETTFNLYLNGGRYWIDSSRLDGTPFEQFDLELSDTTGGGGGFGYSITDRWAMEGAIDYFSADIKDIDEKVDVYNYHVDLFYHFLGSFCGAPCVWQPYVAVGVGEVRIEYNGSFGPDDPEEFESDWHRRQTMVNAGFGLKYQLGPRWQTRADIRAFQGVEEGGIDGFLSVAIGYQWAEYPLVVRDTDADGYVDGVDRCPQTPPGLAVGPDGCPLDGDYDGVPDYLDRCPRTQGGVAVTEEGCPE